MTRLRQVFCVVADCHAPSGHYRSLWQRHFYDGLRAVVDRLTIPANLDWAWARRAGPEPAADMADERSRVSEHLAAQILREHAVHGLDAVISYCFGGDVQPEVVRRVIAAGVPWVNFFCDSTYRFAEVEPLARVVSLNWFVEHAAIPNYRALGVPFLCLPYALTPPHLPDCACVRPERAAAFIGMPTGPRVEQLGQLLAAGARLEIRGPGWREEPTDNAARQAMLFHGLGDQLRRQPSWPQVQARTQGPLRDEEVPEYLRGCRVVLGLNQGLDGHGRQLSYLKLRDLEFPGHGCCYLTEHNDDVAAALDVGTEVLTYRTLGEAAQLLRELPRQPEHCVRIGEAGRRRVLADHTWAARVRQLAAAL
ncbi:MAG: hypothetical protein FD161_2794 [Limisphaerales bacterium]|nr:MAG: hypothetical protein FD161_2794 [Limisphaerales bacterium]KAG0508292.1 MAG: hypothetical protein E1N63_2545 [Limisphaerales bacterium]TXT49607.1 MAG: hypothetical protein FD140_2933 [Limisphaerales bacterium]